MLVSSKSKNDNRICFNFHRGHILFNKKNTSKPILSHCKNTNKSTTGSIIQWKSKMKNSPKLSQHKHNEG